MITEFESGAKRESLDGERWDLIPYEPLRQVAEAFAEGAKKYGAYNWKKGMPFSTVLNHLLRHIHLWQSGDRSENHLSHAICNLMFLIDYSHNIELGHLTASLNDLFYKENCEPFKIVPDIIPPSRIELPCKYVTCRTTENA